MDKDLIQEIDYEISILIDSGFYCCDEILEIIEEQFIDEDLSLDIINELILNRYEKNTYKQKNHETTDFNRLVECFNQINKENIIAIHNAGYSIDEGIHDAFEVFHHLKVKNISPYGFCFYNFQDIELAINSNLLKITFGDFIKNEAKSLDIGKTITKIFKASGFSVKWSEDINSKIEINPFKWEKSFDDQEYEMEGAFNSYLKNYQ